MTFEAAPLSLLTQKSRVRLGIRHDNTLVTVFGNNDSPWLFEDVFIRPISSVGGLLSYITTDFGFVLRRIGWPHGPKDARVHKQFLLIFDELRGDLVQDLCALLEVQKEDIKRANPPKLEVCSHGLGGALATLCALWFATMWPHAEITCVTLGSPKVGNGHFAHEFLGRSNVKCYRLVVESDPFASMPYGGDYRGAPGWQHVGTEIRLSQYDKDLGVLERTFHMAGRFSELFVKGKDAIEVVVIYLGVYVGAWMFYWFLKGFELLLTVSVHGPRVYIASFEGLVESLLEEKGDPGEMNTCN